MTSVVTNKLRQSFLTTSIYEVATYTQMHLISQFAKVADIGIPSRFVLNLTYTETLHLNQIAYMLTQGARDALAQMVPTIISLLKNNETSQYTNQPHAKL